jgi:PIN domain nuclease of toxin-antitoxin system
MILLDTHALIWLVRGTTALGTQSRRLCTSEPNTICVSAITFWEIALLDRAKRVELHMDIQPWRQWVLGLGIDEIAVDGSIGIAAWHIEAFHQDPADRLIVATAVKHGATLLTADRRILDWSGRLQRHDART